MLNKLLKINYVMEKTLSRVARALGESGALAQTRRVGRRRDLAGHKRGGKTYEKIYGDWRDGFGMSHERDSWGHKKLMPRTSLIENTLSSKSSKKQRSQTRVS